MFELYLRKTIFKNKTPETVEFLLTTQNHCYHGYCYSMCFELLKELKNGKIYFIKQHCIPHFHW